MYAVLPLQYGHFTVLWGTKWQWMHQKWSLYVSHILTERWIKFAFDSYARLLKSTPFQNKLHIHLRHIAVKPRITLLVVQKLTNRWFRFVLKCGIFALVHAHLLKSTPFQYNQNSLITYRSNREFVILTSFSYRNETNVGRMYGCHKPESAKVFNPRPLVWNRPKNENSSIVSFYFESISVLHKEEIYVIDDLEFVGSVGGSLGLFIGFSFYSYFMDLIQMLMQHFCNCWCALMYLNNILCDKVLHFESKYKIA